MEAMNILMVQMGNECLEVAMNQVNEAFDFCEAWLSRCLVVMVS